MGEKTSIAWTEHTVNIVWGCTKISPGCKNCYAEEVTERYDGERVLWGPKGTRRTLSDNYWEQPRRWSRKARKAREQGQDPGYPFGLVFCSSMCDVFEDHPIVDAERSRRLWDAIRETPDLEWQILTKRPERIAESLPEDWSDLAARVWVGTSIENDDYTFRAEMIKAIPARVHFISYEPALGPVPSLKLDGIEWVIYGGESGPNFRPHDVQWARDIRARCRERGIPFFYKQSSHRFTERGIELDGCIVRDFPAHRSAGLVPHSHEVPGAREWVVPFEDAEALTESRPSDCPVGAYREG